MTDCEPFRIRVPLDRNSADVKGASPRSQYPVHLPTTVWASDVRGGEGEGEGLDSLHPVDARLQIQKLSATIAAFTATATFKFSPTLPLVGGWVASNSSSPDCISQADSVAGDGDEVGRLRSSLRSSGAYRLPSENGVWH